jgi:hypothetical protein
MFVSTATTFSVTLLNIRYMLVHFAYDLPAISPTEYDFLMIFPFFSNHFSTKYYFEYKHYCKVRW